MRARGRGTQRKGPVRHGTERVKVCQLMEKDNLLNVTGRDEGGRGKDWSVYGHTHRATPGYLSSS